MANLPTEPKERDLPPPPFPARHIRRPRLSEWMGSPLPATVVVSAPAWFGKTTLLREWHDDLRERGILTVWISARELKRRGRSMPAAIRAATQRSTTAAIFIDDAPALSKDEQAKLSSLIGNSSEQFMFVLSARGDLPKELTSVWTRGRTRLFTAYDIALDIDEIDAMAKAAGTHIDRADCESLRDRTAGWAGAVKLALDAFSSRQSPNERPAESLRRIQGILFGVIEQSSLESIPLKTQVFLENVCILEALTVPLCRALSEMSDCDAHLQRLKKSGAFIHEDLSNSGTYRFNPLFRELLERRLQSLPPKKKNILHERASRWFAENDQIIEALKHSALAGNLKFHLSNLERFCEEMVYRGEIRWLEKYAADIPVTAMRTLPRLSLVLAWWRTRQYRFGEAEELIGSVRSSLAREIRSSRANDIKHAELIALLKHRELTLKSARSATPISDQECHRLIVDFSKTNNDGLRLNLYAQLFASYRRQYRIPEILKLEAQASELAERCGIVTFTPWMRAELGAAHVEYGRSAVATRLFERSLKDASRFEGVRAGLSALSGLYLADLCYEADDRVSASRLIETHLPAARDFGLVDQLVTAYAVLAKLRVADGDIDGAIATLEDGMRFSEERQLDRLRRCLQGEKVRLFASLGSPTSLDELELPPSGRRDVKDSDSEIYDAAKARVLLSESRHTDALRLANSWISFCTGNLAVRTLIRWQLIRTHALLLSGDIQNARRSLRESLAGAGRSGFLRKIVDSAPPVRTLLLESYQAHATQNNEIDVFATKAIRIISGDLAIDANDKTQRLDESNALGASLTAKEREILNLVAGGLQNREIGERLGITEGTVKWHMQQIFTKLGVRRRAQAISVFRGSS